MTTNTNHPNAQLRNYLQALSVQNHALKRAAILNALKWHRSKLSRVLTGRTELTAAEIIAINTILKQEVIK